MRRGRTHVQIDEINAAEDRLIAVRLRRGREPLRTAKRNLRRWMARDGARPRAVFQEWMLVLTRLTPTEIAGFLESNTPRARRLRQSSPFAGVLSESERESIRRRHAPTRT